MIRYLAETDISTSVDETRLLIKQIDHKLYRYDPNRNDWVRDFSLGIIYTDHIEVEPITEQKALEIQERMRRSQ